MRIYCNPQQQVVFDCESNATLKEIIIWPCRYEVEDAVPILYVYEVQLEPAVQRKGLGVFLMTLLKLLAKKSQLEAIMLTVMNVSSAEIQCSLHLPSLISGELCSVSLTSWLYILSILFASQLMLPDTLSIIKLHLACRQIYLQWRCMQSWATRLTLHLRRKLILWAI